MEVGEPSALAAASETKRAAELFDRATLAYEQQDWATAAEYYERAEDTVPSPTTAEYAIRSRVKAQHWSRAANLALLTLARYPEQEDLVRLCRETLTDASPLLHRVDYDCTSACQVEVDGAKLPPAEERHGSLFLEPGAHVVVAVRSGLRRKQSVDATPGGRSRLSFSDEELPVEPGPRPEPKVEPEARPADIGEDAGWSPVVFWTGAGLTALTAGLTIWSGVDTLSNPGPDRVRLECAESDTSCPTYRDGLAAQRRTNYLLGATGALAVSTALVGALLTDWDPQSDQQRGLEASRPRLRARVDGSATPDGPVSLELYGVF